MKNLNRLKELVICAILQGFGKDLRPLYPRPVIDLDIFIKLNKIAFDK